MSSRSPRRFTATRGVGSGATGDELVRKMLAMAMSFRAEGVGRIYAGCRPDPAVLDFIWRLGEVAAAGGDIRDEIFGPSSPTG
jgi:hypothetical protein